MDGEAFGLDVTRRLDDELRCEVPRFFDADRSARLWREARDAWPALSLCQADFAEHLAAKLRVSAICPESLPSVRGADLYLAAACGHGDVAAIAAFERSVVSRLRHPLERAGAAAADIEDTLQNLREQLLVDTPTRRARIIDYNGLGKLYSWTRIAALRMSRNGSRKVAREVYVESDTFWERVLPSGHPEVEHMKTRYRAAFRAALGEAVASLDPQQKVLLRQTFVDGLTSSHLAALHGVHRATASRWVVAAQEALFSAVRGKLMGKLAVDAGELESILRLIRSRFDTGVAAELAAPDAA